MAGGDILKMSQVERLRVLELFTFMMYESDVRSLESVNYEHDK